MIRKPSRAAARVKRHYRIRNNVNGTAQRPRLAVFRSNKHMYAQIIDDVTHHTLVAASTLESEIASKVEFTSTAAAAAVVGEVIAKRAVEKGINVVVFDRGGFVYQGKVKALADAAREAGLQF
ncbi:MAG: 50S ribosomal protein L18 [Anaerotignum sp.]|nr:50S ribosomal protein L18 [Anaerotignum sp.]